MKNKTKKVILFIASCMLLSTSIGAHPPEGIQSDYNMEKGLLEVKVLHRTDSPESHYVKRITVSLKEQNRAMQEISRQEKEEYASAFFYLPALSSRTAVNIKAVCSISGSIEETIMIHSTEITDENEMDFETLQRGFYGGIKEERAVIVQTEEEWRDLWAEIYSGRKPVPETPKIDFSKKTVAAVFMGQRPTGGYSVNIENIYFQDGNIRILYRYSKPQPQRIVTQALTFPFHIVIFNTPGEIEKISFEEINR